MKPAPCRHVARRSSLTVPLWLDNQYLLHILIITGIFIIAAMSLNLLLGYTGQLSSATWRSSASAPTPAR